MSQGNRNRNMLYCSLGLLVSLDAKGYEVPGVLRRLKSKIQHFCSCDERDINFRNLVTLEYPLNCQSIRLCVAL